jgi:hypothetical protein
MAFITSISQDRKEDSLTPVNREKNMTQRPFTRDRLFFKRYSKLSKALSVWTSISMLAGSLVFLPAVRGAVAEANPPGGLSPSPFTIPSAASSTCSSGSCGSTAPTGSTGCSGGNCRSASPRQNTSGRVVDGFNPMRNGNSSGSGNNGSGMGSGGAGAGGGMLSRFASQIGPMMMQLLPLLITMMMMRQQNQEQKADDLMRQLLGLTPTPTATPTPIPTRTPSTHF